MEELEEDVRRREMIDLSLLVVGGGLITPVETEAKRKEIFLFYSLTKCIYIYIRKSIGFIPNKLIEKILY